MIHWDDKNEKGIISFKTDTILSLYVKEWYYGTMSGSIFTL